MKPIEFPEQTIIIAKDQPEYMSLPAHVSSAGIVTSLWNLTWRERFVLLLTGKLWVHQWAFFSPLQPQSFSVDRPLILSEEEEDDALMLDQTGS